MLRKSPPRERKEEKISTLSSRFVCDGVVSLILTVVTFSSLLPGRIDLLPVFELC